MRGLTIAGADMERQAPVIAAPHVADPRASQLDQRRRIRVHHAARQCRDVRREPEVGARVPAAGILANATGTITDADATNVTVSCTVPRYRMVAQNWGDLSLRVTDDLGALANNATATPRIIVGATTTLTNSRLDSVAYDAKRDTIYAASHTSATVTVFATAATATGKIAPTRTITISGETALQGIEVDSANDRLFLTSATKLYVLSTVSALTGAVTAPVAIPLTNAAAISRDPINDRLFVDGDFRMTLYIFDNASALTSASTPAKTVTWTGWRGPPAVAIDGCRDRLYLGSNNTSSGGFNMFAFDTASALSRAIAAETLAQDRINIGQAISTVVDRGYGMDIGAY